MAKPHLVIITPAMANANNGNWHTASRWAEFLRRQYEVTLLSEWDGVRYDAMIALHARRSSSSVAAFAKAFPLSPCVVVLTGTDLYHDIRTDAAAQRSLQLATRLVVLQEAGLQELEGPLRSKACVIYQSAPSLESSHRDDCVSPLEVIMIGHLRKEKDPLTFMRAAALVSAPRVCMTHIGGALDAALGEQALATQRAVPHYRWLGNLPHDAARERLRQSRLMVLTSRMEGGANVVIEAVTSGVPVLASDIAGNRGMLGETYAGYFPVGDSQTLARMIDRALEDAAFHALLQAGCRARAPLFAPEREQRALLQLVESLIHGN